MRWKPKVKICCISGVEEARMAIDHGASAIGLVSEMPSGPGVISEDLIANIAGQRNDGWKLGMITHSERSVFVIPAAYLVV